MSSITPPEAAIEGQSMPAMSWMPSLVLAAAPAWYLFVGRKNLVLSPNAKPFYKIVGNHDQLCVYITDNIQLSSWR